MEAPLLKKNDTIGIFAPSSWVEREDIEQSARYVEEQGYKTLVHPQTYVRHHQSAGTHDQKLAAFYDLWDNPDVTCIWAAGGGNRAMHWMDMIDYGRLKKTPKFLIGFSDVTALINTIYAHTGIKAIHGTTFNRLYKCPQKQQHLDMITGARIIYPDTDMRVLQTGKACGALIGGNLSLMQYLATTLPRNFYKNKILFLEDCNEELSRIDRMLLHMKRSGIFDNVSALLFGDFGNFPETGKPFGFSFEEIIKEHTDGIDIPVIMQAPFGHEDTLFPLPIGFTANLNATKNHVEFMVPPLAS
mgnify:CR=1 FL=1